MIAVLHSGGINSTVLLYEVSKTCLEGFVAVGVTKNAKERAASDRLYEALNIRCRTYDYDRFTDFDPLSLFYYGMRYCTHAKVDNLQAGFDNQSGKLAYSFFDLGNYASNFGVSYSEPYINLNKKWIILKGWELGVDLANTWSCIHENELQCGVCHKCKDRKEAFAAAGLQDSTRYEVGTFERNGLKFW